MSFVLLCILVVSFVIQLLIYIGLFARLSIKDGSNPEKRPEHPAVSLVIAFKDESPNLSAHLAHWVSQDYPNLEIILVDDHSTDDSVSIIEQGISEHTDLKIYTNQGAGKKEALSTGISAASGTWIITTDADCKPSSDSWVSEMIYERQQSDVILGYGPYKSDSGFLNKFIRYETWLIAMQYLSLAKVGLPYMGVGRNLAYKKEVFLKQGGFADHAHIKSGDDDLFIAGLTPDNKVGLNLNSFTYSIPANSLTELIQQKRRHLTTAYSYKLKHKIILIAMFVSQFMFYTTAVGLWINSSYLSLVSCLFLIRTIVLLWVAQQKMSLLKEWHLWYWAPVLDILLLAYYCLMGLLLPMKKKTW